MRLFLSARFMRSYEDAPSVVKKALQKQGRLLLGNIRHPSLHAKKYNEAEGIWQARVNRDWRFYFTIAGDTYYL
jgi:hypothetical protein